MRICPTTRPPANQPHQGEEGFLLVGVIVAIALILLVLSIAAPKVAQELRREREVETIHRGNQYVRAIRMYYQKFGSYPASIDKLENTNNMRFLRQRYIDPMTGKDDWRLIPVGQNKTTVKGFFGEALGGLPGAGGGLGSAAGMTSSGQGGTSSGSNSSSFGSSSGFGSGSSGSSFGSGSSGSSFGSSSLGSGSLGSSGTGGSSFGSSGSGSGSTGAGGASGSGSGGSNSSGSGSGSSSSSMFGSSGSIGPFMGVGLPKDQKSIVTLNGQTTYLTWEFLYDPRIEQLYAKANLFGGGMTSTDASSLGTASGMNSGFGGSSTPGGSNTNGSSFGGSNGSSFGSSNGSSFGSSPTSGSGGSSPQNPQQSTPQPQ